MRRSPLAALTAGLLIAGLTGCGSTTTVRSGQTLRVALTEYRVTPQDVDVPAGLVTISVHNYGRLSHDLVISQGSVTEASTQPIAPGQTTDLVAVLSPGTYQMASTVLADQALGAYGTLTVG